MKRFSVLLLALAVGCGGSDSTAPPAAVNIQLSNVTRTAAAGGGTDVIRTTITNTGGAGSYKLQFWSFNASEVNGALHVASETDVASVAAGYSETITWTVPLPVGWVPIQRITAESRDNNSAAYRETSSVTVPK